MGTRVPLRYVPQQTDADCGVATLAMVAGTTYKGALRLLSARARRKVADGTGIDHGDLEAALRKAGFVAFLAINEHYAGGDKRRAVWPPEPVGWRHVISSRNVDGTAHFSAMDANGRVFDPANRARTDLSAYYAVDEVTVVVRPTKPFTYP